MTAPIALFVYNRPMHTRETVEALQKNALATESDLIIYADAERSSEDQASVAAVREYLRKISGFKSVSIVERSDNWGVDKSVIDGVTSLCAKYGRVIVIEDDIVTSPWFLTYMNEALARYKDDVSVMQISGFMFPAGIHNGTEACFLPHVTSWGWATWNRAWIHFDPAASGYSVVANSFTIKHRFNLHGSYDYFSALQYLVDGHTSAWDIRWYLSVFLKQGISLFPTRTLVKNIGFDGSGTHSSTADFIDDQLWGERITEFPSVKVDMNAQKAVERYLKKRLKFDFQKACKAWISAGRQLFSQVSR